MLVDPIGRPARGCDTRCMPAKVIVEGDDPGFRSCARQLLTTRGASVVGVADSGDQAIAVAWLLPATDRAGAVLRDLVDAAR
jgi:DNA-binding NarL/FixJ family response regulator